MNIAVEGCCHGELDVIYAAVEHAQLTSGTTVDLLICCGDFQSVRNPGDLRCMAAPLKHLKMQTFYKYYSGEKKAPVLTLFIGGNHEASNYLQELPYGGWVAPNIYYLGYGGVVNVGGLRIGGVSGIYKGVDYLKGKYERSPYTQSSIRSVYHVRNLEVFRMKQLDQSAGPLDIFLSHDWPRGVTKFGDGEKLCRLKPFFKDEVQSETLGSKPAQELLHHLQPRYWFAGHLHVKFVAMVDHSQNMDSKNQNTNSKQAVEKLEDKQMTRFTRFLALDKCLPRREFLHILKIKYGKLHKYQNVVLEPSCDSQEIPSNINIPDKTGDVRLQTDPSNTDKTGDAILPQTDLSKISPGKTWVTESPQTDPHNNGKTEDARSQTDSSGKTGDTILPQTDLSKTDKTGGARSLKDPSGKTGDTRSPQTDPSNNNNSSRKTGSARSPETDGVPDTNLYSYSPFDESGCVQLHHDLEWLTVLRLTDHLMKVTPQPVYMPGPGHSERYDFTPSKEDLLETLRRMDDDLRVRPIQFCRTAQAFDPDRDALLIEHLDTVNMPEPAFNPYTQELCERLGIRDPLAELVKDAHGRSPHAARAARGVALPAEADLTLDASRLTFTDEGSTSEGEAGGDIVFEVSICDNTDGTSQGLLSPVISPSRVRTRQQPQGSPLVVSSRLAASDGDSDSAAALTTDSAESLGQDSADTSSQSDAENVTPSPSCPKRTSLCLSAPRYAVTDDVVDDNVAPAVSTDVSNVETSADKPLPKPTKIRRRNAALYAVKDE